jgi:hypothetical protein
VGLDLGLTAGWRGLTPGLPGPGRLGAVGLGTVGAATGGDGLGTTGTAEASGVSALVSGSPTPFDCGPAPPADDGFAVSVVCPAFAGLWLRTCFGLQGQAGEITNSLGRETGGGSQCAQERIVTETIKVRHFQ